MSFGVRARTLALLLAATPAMFVTREHDARASVSIAVTFDGLLRETQLAAVATPVEQRALWENGRIYTYTRMTVDRVIAGATPSGASDVWVRTMGGIVGKIGQSVDGEAVFVIGRPSLLFLHPGPSSVVLEVTARGQGQFPLVVDEKKATRVMRASNVGALLAPKGTAPTLAADVIHGRLLDDVARDVAAAHKRVHAK